MKRRFQTIKVVLICLILAFSAQAQKSSKHRASKRRTTHARQSVSATSTEYVPVLKYDPSRNADQDIKNAVAEAKRTGKRILLEVGGNWCIWCHIMDEYFEKHSDLLSFREKNFIMVKINYSDENKNIEVLSRYPEIPGYPHLFVLDTNGKFLYSKNTGELEEGRGYNLERFMAFLKEWSPKAKESAKR
ncbi:MAG TPA: thioredoxin family protein [Pyrinomonadaceae bacterium]|nr:thioredoxin family protein [Pyrinomonadaceae bacterium]